MPNSKFFDLNALSAKNLFDFLPFGLLLMNQDGDIQAINKFHRRVLGLKSRKIVGKQPGVAFNCLNAIDAPETCGQHKTCNRCELRALAKAALNDQMAQKGRVNLLVSQDRQVRDLTALLNAVPIEWNQQKYVLIVVQDITGLKSIFGPTPEEGFWGIIGQDPKMLELYDTIRHVAQTNFPVLLTGESGTGKELVALAIHKESDRSRRHFVPCNCSALPSGLIESELFGHVRGAFTGAIRDKKGRFELAHKGTIFLDEISELSEDVQVKLLRVLQMQNFERVGGELTQEVDVRIISATNRDLYDAVDNDDFREDLFYRLSVVPIALPPLRQRRGDIPLLVDYFLPRFCEEAGRDLVKLSRPALNLMEAYDWPGNVRELQNLLQFALIKCHGPVIEPEHLPPYVNQRKKKLAFIRPHTTELTEERVSAALKSARGNRRRAAELLGVSRSTLYRFFDRIQNETDRS